MQMREQAKGPMIRAWFMEEQSTGREQTQSGAPTLGQQISKSFTSAAGCWLAGHSVVLSGQNWNQGLTYGGYDHLSSSQRHDAGRSRQTSEFSNADSDYLEVQVFMALCSLDFACTLQTS